MKLLVTGGAGFIGSTYVRLVLEQGDEVTVLDKLTYAGRPENLQDVADRIRFVEGAIEDRDTVGDVVAGHDAIVNFAAESHVDRSIADQEAFARTHVIGTSVLLDAAREHGVGRYLQVSTDEVYGSIESGSFTESSPLDPSSPYSATKAAGEPLPVYGDGRQVRNWLYVEDFARAIDAVLRQGQPGEVYNVGGPDEAENIDVVRRILALTGRDESLIEHVTDRPGHDRRYSLSADKTRALGWEPKTRFAEGLERTIQWYRDNDWWWEPIRSGEYRAYYERQYGRAIGERTVSHRPAA